jgi:hypothetical protein
MLSKVVELTTEKGTIAQEFYPDAEIIRVNPLNRSGRRRGLSYPDESLDGIFAHYILQQISWRETVPSVLDWARCLREGSLLHIIVPSQRWIARQLLQEKVEPHVKPMLFGAQDKIWNTNRSTFSLLDLRILFETAGLGIVKAKIGAVEMVVDKETYQAEQLYIAGIKSEFAGGREKFEVEGD